MNREKVRKFEIPIIQFVRAYKSTIIQRNKEKKLWLIGFLPSSGSDEKKK